jgi:hypothetical protein
MSDPREQLEQFLRDMDIPVMRTDFRFRLEYTPTPRVADLACTMTPCEMAQDQLGYVPEGTPGTWEEVDAINARFQPGWKPGETLYIKSNAFGSALDNPLEKSE